MLLFLFVILLALCIWTLGTVPSFFLPPPPPPFLPLGKDTEVFPTGDQIKAQIKYLGQIKHECVNTKIGLRGWFLSSFLT